MQMAVPIVPYRELFKRPVQKSLCWYQCLWRESHLSAEVWTYYSSFQLFSVHSLRSMTLAARPLHNVNIIWSLMKLENSRDWLQLGLGWVAVPGSDPGAAWDGNSARQLAPLRSRPAETPSKVWQWLSDQPDNTDTNNFLSIVWQYIRREFLNVGDFYKPIVPLRMSQLRNLWPTPWLWRVVRLLASPGPGSVSRLESGKISCSRSSQQLSNDVAHLAVMKHFQRLKTSGHGSAMGKWLLRLWSDGCHMTGLFTFYIVWTQRILDRGRPSCLNGGGWLTTCLFTWPGCAATATISSRTHRFGPVKLSVSCRKNLYHCLSLYICLVSEFCLFQKISVIVTSVWEFNCYKTGTRPKHVLIKSWKPQQWCDLLESRLWLSPNCKFSVYRRLVICRVV